MNYGKRKAMHKYKNSPAVLKHKTEAGTVIKGEHLEDPAIFDDLIDAGLLDIKGALSIENVLGERLLYTCESLTPITKDILRKKKKIQFNKTSCAEELQKSMFISYAKKDWDLAKKLCDELERKGLACWIAPRNIDIAGDWASQILRAIGNSKYFLVVLSGNSMESNEVLKEITLASEMKKEILALCVNGCEPENAYKYHLSIVQRMNLKPDNVAEIINAIESKVKNTI